MRFISTYHLYVLLCVKKMGRRSNFSLKSMIVHVCTWRSCRTKEVIIWYLVFIIDSFIACCDIFSQTLLVCVIYAIKKEITGQICHESFSMCVITGRVRSTTGGYIFSLSVHTLGWGVLPHLHPIILPLAPCPFWGGGTPVIGPRSLPGGYHRTGVPLVGTGVPPSQNWGNPPPPARTRVTFEQVTPKTVPLLRFPTGGLSCWTQVKCYNVSFLKTQVKGHSLTQLITFYFQSNSHVHVNVMALFIQALVIVEYGRFTFINYRNANVYWTVPHSSVG